MALSCVSAANSPESNFSAAEEAAPASWTSSSSRAAPAGSSAENGEAPAAETRVTVALDDLSATATDGRFDRLLLPAWALLAEGDITETGRDADGRRTVTVTAAGVRIVFAFTEKAQRPALLRLEADGYGEEMRISWKE